MRTVINYIHTYVLSSWTPDWGILVEALSNLEVLSTFAVLSIFEVLSNLEVIDVYLDVILQEIVNKLRDILLRQKTHQLWRQQCQSGAHRREDQAFPQCLHPRTRNWGNASASTATASLVADWRLVFQDYRLDKLFALRHHRGLQDNPSGLRTQSSRQSVQPESFSQTSISHIQNH